MMAHQLKPRPSSLAKPVRDKKYLAWLRTQPCIVCVFWATSVHKIEAAHTGQAGAGMGQKASDYDALPLCGSCHRTGDGAYHRFGSEAKWADIHGLDLPAIRAGLRRKYAAQKPQRTERDGK